MACLVNIIFEVKMKLLVAILIALALVCPTNGQTIKDSLGNQISPYQWVWFNSNVPFNHPNGHSYKNVWVYTKPRQYANYQGWLTVASLVLGIVDAVNHDYMNDWGGSSGNIWRFTGIVATGYITGYLLDWHKAKGKPKGYTYLVRNPRTQ